jgi:Protein of unknown function (DUF1499)
MKLRRERRATIRLILVPLLGIPLILVMALGLLNPTNVAQTLRGHPDPRLRTRHYSHSLEHVSQVVRATILQLKTYGRAWRLIQRNGLLPLRLQGQNSVKTEEVQVPVLFFTDDLVVTMRGDDNRTTVDVRSASRVGRSDLGENRRHILQLLHALDGKLGR